MQHEQPEAKPSFQPGDRVVVVGDDAQKTVGGTEGTVVGQKGTMPASDEQAKVIVAIDQGPPTNAVIDPVDLQRQQEPS
jgi:hypothetical protein